MQNAKSAATPLPAGYVPKPLEEQANPERRSRFQTVIGSLLYLMLGTQPDIAFAVTKLAQYASNPSEDHLSKALYICRYLVGTQHTEHQGKVSQLAPTRTGRPTPLTVDPNPVTLSRWQKDSSPGLPEHRKLLRCPVLRLSTWRSLIVAAK